MSDSMIPQEYKTSPELLEALKKARDHKMTPQERFEQKLSFVSEGVHKERVRKNMIDNCAVPHEITDAAFAAGVAWGIKKAAERMLSDDLAFFIRNIDQTRIIDEYKKSNKK